MAEIATVHSMPSPVGHLLAGVTTAWVAEALPSLRHRFDAARPSASAAAPAGTPLVLLCAALALAPDVDILFSSHRTAAHSVGALGLVLAAAALAARWRGWPVLATTLACGIAFGGHVFLDWLGQDGTTPIGLMALWPFTDAYYISGTDLFAGVSRRYWKLDEFILGNARTIIREVAILLPVAVLGWILRARSRRLGHGLRPPGSSLRLRSGQESCRATNTGRSPSHSSCRGGQPPPSGAAAGRADTSDRPARRAGPPGWRGRRRGR